MWLSVPRPWGWLLRSCWCCKIVADGKADGVVGLQVGSCVGGSGGGEGFWRMLAGSFACAVLL